MVNNMGALNNLVKVVVGLILVIATVWFSITFSSWGRATLDLIQGGIVLMAIFIGLILILLGFSDLK